MEGEEEIAPGIYLTRHKQPKAESVFKKTIESLGTNPIENLAFLKDQVRRVANSIDKLEYSNNELLKETMEPIIVESIQENIQFIKRQHLFLEQLQEECVKIAKIVGVDLEDLYKPKIQVARQNEPEIIDSEPAEGVYL